MKINRTIFTKFAKRILRRERGLHEPQLMHPEREWFIGLGVAVLIVIGSGAWSANTYLHYESIDADTIDNIAAPAVVYRESLVAAAREEFSRREQTRANLLSEVSTLPDPTTTASSSISTSTPETGDQTATSSDSVATSTTTTSEASAPTPEEPEEVTDTATEPPTTTPPTPTQTPAGATTPMGFN